jgi:hypothetical protein
MNQENRAEQFCMVKTFQNGQFIWIKVPASIQMNQENRAEQFCMVKTFQNGQFIWIKVPASFPSNLHTIAETPDVTTPTDTKYTKENC